MNVFNKLSEVDHVLSVRRSASSADEKTQVLSFKELRTETFIDFLGVVPYLSSIEETCSSKGPSHLAKTGL